MAMYRESTKETLARLLQDDSCGNILEALADLHGEMRESATDDPTAEREFRTAEGALRTLALGIDAVVPV